MAFGNTIRCTETGVHCQSICFTTESADVLMENKNFFTIQKKIRHTKKDHCYWSGPVQNF